MSSPQIERKLAAIMFTDIVGFTKIMGADETTALNILENQQSLINPIVEERKGTIIKKMGDGLLIEFPSTVNAVECATQMQDSIKSYNTSADNLEFHIRIGIHLGDIVILGDDILGDGVNIASRIEPLASPDGICITDAVYQSVKSKLKLDAKRIDEVDLKHIDDKYTIYKMPVIAKDSDNGEKVSSTIESEQPKIKITSFETISKFPNEILISIAKAFRIGFLLHPFFNILHKISAIDNSPFFQDFKIFPSSLAESEWSLFFSLSGDGFIGFLKYLFLISFGMGLILAKKEEKIAFKDIRNVDKMLDYMVKEIGSFNRYQIIEQSGNTISYYPYTRGFKWFDKLLLPIFKNLEYLTLEFDGNVVRIKGVWYNVKKLKKQLKLLELF